VEVARAVTALDDRAEALANQLHSASVATAQIADSRDQVSNETAHAVQVAADTAVTGDLDIPEPSTDRSQRSAAANAEGTPTATGPVTGSIVGTLTVPGSAEHARCAREFVRTALGARPCRDDAVLLTSEMVTNSIAHSRSGDGGEITIVVIDLGGFVRVEVIDDGSDHLPEISRPGTGLADGGRGLQIVSAQAASWGHARDGCGLTTWFEVTDAGANSPPSVTPTSDFQMGMIPW
jgi:anti-sigma regulatory factor (Ser/Thr protein kinase)